MKKSVENRLVEMGITGKIKDDIVADIFGRQVGEVHESGLSDAESQESFRKQMEMVKENWSKCHLYGPKFFQWFVKNKEKKMLNHVIVPVRQRAGLGCPPSKFTTNRSERTNGVIQDFIRQRYGLRHVNVFSFCVALQDLIDMQDKEVELAVVGKGEYRICPAYQNLQVTPAQWVRMTEKQQKQALQKIHTTGVEDRSPASELQVTRVVAEEIGPILGEILEAGVDWLPRDVLAQKNQKGHRNT